VVIVIAAITGELVPCLAVFVDAATRREVRLLAAAVQVGVEEPIVVVV